MAAMIVAGSAALAAEPAAGKTAPASGIAAKVLALTGAETRIVWLRNKQWESRGGVDGGAECSIMAFDTGGKGERELVPAVPEGEIYNPLISPDGRRVIYTTGKNFEQNQMHCVDWNGANHRILGEGFAQWPWRDPATGIEWVYTTSVFGKGDFIDRFQLDNPEKRERVLTEGILNQHLSLSADGTRAAAEVPWPNAGMIYFRTGQADRKNFRQGCNTYMAPDNSYMVTVMAGSHDLVTLYKPDGSSRDVSVVPPGLKPLKNGQGGGCMWNPKWASDARHMVTAGPFKNLGPDRSDIWLGQFADDFNSIAKWVQVTDNDFMDVYAYAWVDPGLGQYAGEAPYTLGVPSLVTGPGNWQWTFGDGAKGTEGKHSYSKAGAYAITATQGNRTLKGTVRVAERMAPKLLSATALDDRRVLLTFSEPVQAAAAKVTLASGTAATKLSLDSEGRGIIAEFAAPLTAKETLTVAGVTDGAQAPNEMAAAKVQVVMPEWPSNRTGVSYLWKNARSRNVVFDEQIGLPITTSLNGYKPFHGPLPARLNRFGAVLAEGEMFDLSPGSSERIMRNIHKTKQFSFEIVVASADLAQTKSNDDKPITIIGWDFHWRNGIFWLFQEKDKLQVSLSKKWGDGNPEVFEMAKLPDTKPHHLLVSWAEKRLAFYLDGKKVKEVDPSPAHLLMPSPPMRFAQNGWRGQVEYIAFYNRFIEEPEAAKNAAVVTADLARRKTLPQIEVQATLIAKSKVPDPKQMAPYLHALIVNEYSVDKVLNGTYAGKTIRVAQWGMRDLKPTPLAAQEPGASVKLVLENFADHEELVPELISDTLKENFDLKLYTDVNLQKGTRQ